MIRREELACRHRAWVLCEEAECALSQIAAQVRRGETARVSGLGTIAEHRPATGPCIRLTLDGDIASAAIDRRRMGTFALSENVTADIKLLARALGAPVEVVGTYGSLLTVRP